MEALDGRCVGCDGDLPTGARWCPSCGAPVGAHLIELEPLDASGRKRRDRPAPAGLRTAGADPGPMPAARTRSRLLSLLAVVAVLAGIAALLSVSGPDDPVASDDTDDPAADASDDDDGGPDDRRDDLDDGAGDDGPPDVDLPSRPLVGVPPLPPPAVGDTSGLTDLPTTAAGHLVAVQGDEIRLLDLAARSWEVIAVGEDLGEGGRILPFGDAVAIEDPAGSRLWIVRPGGAFTRIDQPGRWLLDVGLDTAVFVDWAGMAPSLIAVTAEGTETWRLDMPADHYPVGVDSTGAVIVLAGTAILRVVVGDDGVVVASDVVARGSSPGPMLGDGVLVRDCVAYARCQSEWVDVITGERRPIGDHLRDVALIRTGDVVVGQGRDTVVFSFTDGHPVEILRSRRTLAPGTVHAVDATGLVATLDARTGELAFTRGAPTESEGPIATAVVPGHTCCPGTSNADLATIAFVTLDDADPER